MANDDPGSLLQRHLLLEEALCDPRTSKGDCQVLAVISAHANHESGEAWPGVNRIAKKAGIHRSTVLASVRRLERWRYLYVEKMRGRSNTYCLLTGSAHATSREGELVAPTLPVEEPDQSRPRDGGGSADATGLVAPTLRDQSRPRYPNSAFELSSLTQQENSVACGALSDDQQQELAEQRQEQKRLAEEQRKAEARESIRQEYRETLKTHPDHARMMEQVFPRELADLIEARP